MNEVREATENALNELADLLEYGHLMASTDPAAFIEMATHKIKSLQSRTAASMRLVDEYLKLRGMDVGDNSEIREILYRKCGKTNTGREAKEVSDGQGTH